jgi:hypothetical protein
MKYLRVFNNDAEYQTFTEGDEYVTPNICYINETKGMLFKPCTNHIIYYTSSDNNIITPYVTNVFGANIVSNTYKDGQGMIIFDRYVTSIGAWAFFWSQKLTSIIIPNSVTSIDDYAFYYCNNLINITIPNIVDTIGDRAFSQCISLTNITIPIKVTWIGDYAFENCNNLANIYCKSIIPPVLENASVFINNKEGRLIHVPTTSVDVYKSATNWSTYGDYIVGY